MTSKSSSSGVSARIFAGVLALRLLAAARRVSVRRDLRRQEREAALS